ncbi:MAG: UDP-N-acetylmuramoyl-L-alanyl-D-glutamate--2,6-diaminopimelate ligase, partial [Candidatus Zixiibacteriota bacterium]
IARLCQSAREITDGRLLILFGCGGDRDRGKRSLMGKAAAENADFVVVTSDNPRTEDPSRIIIDILPGVQGVDKLVIPDRQEAIRELVRLAGPDDTLLIAGKGAEDYQEIGTRREPFNDLEEVRSALAELGYVKETTG